MKMQVTKLYQKIRAKMAAFRHSVGEMRQKVRAWFVRKQRAILRAVVIFIVALLAGVVLLYLWRRSPTLRATVIGIVTRLIGWLTGRRNGLSKQSYELRVPILRPEQAITPDGLEKAIAE